MFSNVNDIPPYKSTPLRRNSGRGAGSKNDTKCPPGVKPAAEECA